MKKIAIFLFLIFLAACGDGSNSTDSSGDDSISDYREAMREFVIGISDYAKDIKSNFLIIPQNGIELVSLNGESDGTQASQYLAAIDGNGQEDLFYGYDEDNVATGSEDSQYLSELLDISKNSGNTILVTDYCSTNSYVDDSYSKNAAEGYISFAASERDLNVIPAYPSVPNNENNSSVSTLNDVKNFLYLLDPSNYASKEDFMSAITATNYDLLIMDLYFNETAFTADDITALRSKANGGSRLILCYMSIGEAEDYRYYWNDGWTAGNPSWIKEENPDWEGNYKVAYWSSEWQSIIYGNDDSYLKKILNAGCDGVYLDIIDAFEYFE